MDANTDPSLDREREIFLAALERPSPGERAAFVDGACGNDAPLRARLESLLRHHAEDSFLEDPAADLQRMPLSEPLIRESIGTVIGRYKLLQKIGEGGMGVVYMAEQEEPVRRRVALKIIKLGMDTQQVVARFEAERQALALMDHPNIAKVLDGGATGTGRPYFVMELVQGVPITEFCDKNRLPAEERIKLFILVCQAIQSAHQKGIIHRDIKPNNVMVTLNAGVPMPMVIDFGVAKATQQKLTEKTVFTNYATMIGTPAYMSPEQAEMSRLDVDTRSDIYGLGVLLYELLTGTTPFPEKRLRSASYQEMQRIILEEEPERPSTRLRQTKTLSKSPVQFSTFHSELSTDLDWIVMKCLEKDRARRYETANGLARDLQRHLNNEPVVARPPTKVYRLQKAWRRNKVVFTAAAVMAAALVVGTTVSTWQAIEASRARNDEKEQRLAAQTERDKAQAAQNEAERAQQAEKEALLRADHQLYVADMNLAQQAWEQNNIGQLRQLLEDTQGSPYRGFEWCFWQRLIHLELKTLRGHLDGVYAVAFSPDGQRIVTGSADMTAKVWEAASGRELLTLRGHKNEIHSVAFSPDGQRIVTGSYDGTAREWEAASGRGLLTLNGHNAGIESVAFSPDGQRIVTGSWDNTAKVWETASGKPLLTLSPSALVMCVAFSPDGQRIVTGGWDKTAKVWDAASGTNLLTLTGHSNGVFSVAFSPDGKRIVTGGGDHVAKVWDAATGTNLLTLKGHKSWVRAVAFSPDGQRIVTGSGDPTAEVWDAASGTNLVMLKGHSGQIRSVAYSPDGQRIVTGSLDETAKVWDVANGLTADKAGGELLTLKGHSEQIWCVAFSPDGQRIVTGSFDQTAKVWDAASGTNLLTLTGHSDQVFGVAYSPDGQRIVTGSVDNTAKVWDAASGTNLLTLKHSNWVLAVAFSPDGQRIVTGSKDNTAKVWDATSGTNLLTLNGHSDGVFGVAFSPDGQRIVTGGWDKTAKVWDAASGTNLVTLKGHSGVVSFVAFSPNGQRIVTGSRDNTAKVWDAASGTNLLTLKGHNGWVESVAFSPDGQRIVTGSWDNTAKVWEAAKGAELLTLKGHNNYVESAAFSPDGQRIVTGSWDNTAKVWEAATAKQVAAWREEERAADKYVAALRERQELKQDSFSRAQSGRWAEAATDLARAIEQNATDHELWHWLAGIYVQTGQLEAYRENCGKALERFRETTDPYTADRIAKDCLILPGSGANLDTVSAMADDAVAQGQHSPDLPYFQFCKGLAEYRQGRFTSAADWMGTVLTNGGSILPLATGAYMVLAMSQCQMGQIEQARASLAKGAEIEQKLPKLDSGDLGDGWIDWIIAHALMREAKAMIGSLPARASDSPRLKKSDTN
jgi:WD40 repeat protein/serine/threonine protein kinase